MLSDLAISRTRGMRGIAAFIVPWLVLQFPPSLGAAGPLTVSLVQLIANPHDYDGKVVRVIGFVSLEFEGNAIYLHQDDYKHGIHQNGLWLKVTDDLRTRARELHKKYLIIEGTFDTKLKGHKGLWNGGIREITRCDLWSEGDGRK